MPESPPPASRAKRPSGGSGVSRVMPASSNAVLLNQFVCPPRWATSTGWSGTAASRCVRCRGPSTTLVSSNMKPRTHRPGGVSRAFRRSAAWISATVRRSVFTPYSSFTPLGWEWVSMNPGVTVIPPASITSVPGPTRFPTSPAPPTATNRSPRTANASARGLRVVDGVDPGVHHRQVRVVRLPGRLLRRRGGQPGLPRTRRPARPRDPGTPCASRLPSLSLRAASAPRLQGSQYAPLAAACQADAAVTGWRPGRRGP